MAQKEFKLTPLQGEFLRELSRSSLKNTFYWTGGTALAYFHLQHRFSLDLDFFSDNKFNYSEVLRFVQQFSEKTHLKNIEQEKIFDRWEFIISNGKKTRVEFVYYDFRPLKPRKKWNGILVDSLDDMAANKTQAMIDRNEPKDVFDIYFLLTKKKFTPTKLLRLVKTKFGVEFSLSLFWSEALRKAKRLSVLKPLLFVSEKEKLMRDIVGFFEEQAAKEMRRLIG